VGGEAMSQGVHMDVLAQAGSLEGAPADHLDGARADRPVGLTPGDVDRPFLRRGCVACGRPVDPG
jgi:hypothetical protein